jgi:hypothetical protein
MRFFLFAEICFAIFAIVGGSLSCNAATRQVLFVIEEPLISWDAPPQQEQVNKINEVRDLLVQRISQVEIESHKIIDGNAALSTNPITALSSSNVIVQILLTASWKGYRVDTHVFDASKNIWYDGTAALFGDQASEKLEATISNKIIPPTLVRIFEIAQPSGRSLLFADCLVPSIESENAAKQAGRILSFSYAQNLRASAELQKAFSIVPLVNTNAAKFYSWWCMDILPPRCGILRDDTLTISGQIESIRSGQSAGERLVMSLQGKRPDGNLISRNLIPLDLQNEAITLQKIRKAVEELTKKPWRN